MRRVLSLHLPTWPTDRVRRRLVRGPGAPGPDDPILLIGTSRGQRVVAHYCQRARAAGVRRGMSVPHARARLEGGGGAAVVLDHEPQREAAALRALAQWAVRFSPVVVADPPEGLLLDITGCGPGAPGFGGERRLVERVTGAVGGLGFSVRAAAGPTIGCAWAVARYGAREGAIIGPGEVEAALRPLPVAALRIDEPTREAMAAVAVDRVGDLMELGRGELAARFGEGLLLRMDQAMGRAFEGLSPPRPTEPVHVEREFAGPVKRLEAVERAARELLAELAVKLAERESGARRIVLRMDRFDADPIEAQLVLCQPGRDAKHLWKLLRPKLERMNLGWGIERLALHVAAAGPLPHEQGRCWRSEGRAADGAATTDRAAAELVDLLAGRLGADRVRRIDPAETHVPERAFISRPCERPGPGRPARITDADRPSVLYGRPEPVRVMLMAPEGPVISLARRGEARRIVTTIGPERITPRWWLAADDGIAPPPRDYFKVQDEAGRWWWVYRQAGTGRWFVHGEWA